MVRIGAFNARELAAITTAVERLSQNPFIAGLMFLTSSSDEELPEASRLMLYRMILVEAVKIDPEAFADRREFEGCH